MTLFRIVWNHRGYTRNFRTLLIILYFGKLSIAEVTDFLENNKKPAGMTGRPVFDC